MQIVDHLALVCDGRSLVSIVDLTQNNVSTSVSLSNVVGTDENDAGVAYQGHVLVGVMRVNQSTVLLAMQQMAFQNNADSCRVSCIRLIWKGESVEAVLAAQAVGPTSPLTVMLDSWSLILAYSDGIRPFTQTFPVVKPVFGPPVPPSFERSPPQNAFNLSPSTSAATTSLQPKPTALNLLDDAMDEEDDGFYAHENSHSDGTCFLSINLNTTTTNAPSTVNVPNCSFICPKSNSMAVCLKSTVDGLIITFSGTSGVEITHADTIDAFAYVFSSKRDKRFAFVSRDGEFAYIVESSRYLYAYKKAAKKASGSHQWVVDLWETAVGEGVNTDARRVDSNTTAVGDVRGVHDLGGGRVVLLCEDRVLAVDFSV
ncbi:UNVERIFIED_CONTAM: hypothetical protein HDU68_000628 [Siphonaria sp. JEL0065]|nr:hypothetical protein HDU68_000628 [Siphonaria sp. JEL0065]